MITSIEPSNQVEQYRLKTQFLKSCVRHTKHSENHEGAREEVKEDWQRCCTLGYGGSSVVDKQHEINTGRYRAVKIIDKRRLPSRLDYYRELIVMADLAKHSSLFMQFLGWFEESDTLYIAMEYIEKGDLRKHIGKPLPQRTVQQITNQLLEGLKVMHEKGIAHRDLKPENIFVVSTSPFRVKLGDFGLSKRIRDQDLTTYHTQLFTRSYAAPEVLGVDTTSETSVYTKAVDVWSLGCVVYELLAGAKLFHREGLITSYFHGKWPFPEYKLKNLSPPTNDAGISLIKSMVSLQPDDRPSAIEALDHTWIAGLKSEAGGEDNSGDIEKVAQIPTDGENVGGGEVERGRLIASMKIEQSDLVEWYRLETEFLPNRVRHTRHSENPRSEWEEEWSNCEVLGMGGFSVVNKQLESTTGRCRAVKMIDKTKLLGSSWVDYSRELVVMAVLAKHPSLFVKFLGWFEECDSLYIAMEYLEKGDLRKNISGPLPQETVQRITKQLLKGLDAMHQQGIAHRDLKPESIFVVSMDPVSVKLGNFGISKQIYGQNRTTFHTQIATRIYAAPEVLGLDPDSKTWEYTNAVDIWSLGCVVYELLAGERLFSTEGQMALYFYGKTSFPGDTKLKSLSPATNDAGISLIKSMVSVQPNDRPSVLDLLGHTWITDVTSEREGEGSEGSHGRVGVCLADSKGEQKDAQEAERNPVRSKEREVPAHQDPDEILPISSIEQNEQALSVPIVGKDPCIMQEQKTGTTRSGGESTPPEAHPAGPHIPCEGASVPPNFRLQKVVEPLQKWMGNIAGFLKVRDSRKIPKDDKPYGSRIDPRKRSWGIQFGFPRGRGTKWPRIPDLGTNPPGNRRPRLSDEGWGGSDFGSVDSDSGGRATL